jgi:AbrB family looped-hinge helix DNA binding protein
METMDITLAERGQIVIPKEARDAMGLKPGARLQMRLEDGRLVIEKKVQLNLKRWVGHAEDDGLSTAEALAELRGRPVPWQDDTPAPDATATSKAASA